MPIYAMTRIDEPGVIVDIIEAKSPAAAKQEVFDREYTLQPASARDVREFYTGGIKQPPAEVVSQTEIFDNP